MFLHKVANRQTDKQTNNNDYISSLAEVKRTKNKKQSTQKS